MQRMHVQRPLHVLFLGRAREKMLDSLLLRACLLWLVSNLSDTKYQDHNHSPGSLQA